MEVARLWIGRLGVVVGALLCAGGLAGTAGAQTDDDANGAVQFNFSTPGARSLAMGGAFLGSVDDATAAYANPAGLLQITEPEVLLEGRRWRYATPFAERGRISGRTTGEGADTIPSVLLGTAESEADGISYAAAVFPRPTWAGAVFVHRVADFETYFETGGIFSGEGSSTFRLFPVQSAYSLDIAHAGFAYAHRWRDFAAGFSVSAYSFELASLTQRFRTADFYDPVDFSRDERRNFQTQTGDDDAVGFSAGLRWDLSERVSVGMVYRFAPEFEMTVVSSSLSPQVPIPPRQLFIADAAVSFNLPDVAGIGVSIHPSQALTINLDTFVVYYSELIEEMFLFFDESGETTVTAADFVLDDATEIHLGVEYVFTRIATPIALRLGGWFDPDHRLQGVETAPDPTRARLFAGEDQVHITGGLGLVLTSHFQLDAAVDLSDAVDTASLSAAVRF